MSINWHLDAEPAPAILVLPEGAASLDEAHAAIELWEHYKRRSLDPTQRLVVEVMMATHRDGSWAAKTTGREMPRQNGKGDELEVVELWGLVQRAERILHTIHDAVLLATETQSRLLSLIDGHPDLRRLKSRAWRGTGQQMIEMRNEGIIWYRTRTGGGARGVDEVDRVVVDEAQHAEEEQLAAITPTQLASANPQLNAVGTAAIAGKSAWWWRQRRRALANVSDRFGYVGHTAESVRLEGDTVVREFAPDVHDRDVWKAANPALVAGRTDVGFLKEQLATLGDALFAREHLCVWDPEPNAGGGVIDLSDWVKCADPGSQPIDPLFFAIDVSEDRTSSSIGMAGLRRDGLVHVEYVENRPGDHWTVDKVAAVLRKAGSDTVTLAPGGPAGGLLNDLGLAGIKVNECGGQASAQACGAFFDGIMDRRYLHIGQPVLTAAVDGAEKRRSGDAWVWDRRSSSNDVTPLVAVTLAAWALHQYVAPVASGFVDPNDYDDGDD